MDDWKKQVAMNEGSGYQTPPWRPLVDNGTLRSRLKRQTPRPEFPFEELHALDVCDGCRDCAPELFDQEYVELPKLRVAPRIKRR